MTASPSTTEPQAAEPIANRRGDDPPAPDRPVDSEPGERRGRRRLLVGSVFVLATAAMLRRTPGELANRLPGNLGDSPLVMWMLRWSTHGLLHDPRHVYNANIFWPYPHTLAYADSMLSIGPVYSVLYEITGKWAFAWNLLWLGMILLNLGATYSLTRWLTGRSDVAIFAGLAVGFSAFVFNNAGHPQLEIIGLVPLGFLLLFKLLERPRLTTAIFLGVVNVIIALGALYIAAGYVIALFVMVVGFAVAVRGRIDRRVLGCLAVAGVISLIAAPSVIPYHDVQTTLGRRPLVPEWGLRPRDIVRPAVGSYLFKATLSKDTDPASGERHLFPGFTTLGLAAIGLGALIFDIRRRRRSDRDSPSQAPSRSGGRSEAELAPPPERRKFLILLVIEGAVIGALSVGAVGNGAPTPWRLAYHYISPLSGVRVPARLASFSILSGAVLAAVGLAAILRRVRTPAIRWGITAAVCLLLLAELAAPVPYTHIPDDAATLAVYHTLSHRPAGAVVELPIYDPGTDSRDWAFGEPSRMVWSTIDYHPRVNGYSGALSPTYYADTALIQTLPAPAALARLKQMQVRYLILHLGVQTGITMFTDAEAQSIISGLPTATVDRYGPNYLVDLGQPQNP